MNKKELQPVLLGALVLYIIGYVAFWMMFSIEWVVSLLLGIIAMMMVILAYIVAHSVYAKQELKDGLSNLTLAIGIVMGLILLIVPFVTFEPANVGCFFLLQMMNLQVAWYGLRHYLAGRKNNNHTHTSSAGTGASANPSASSIPCTPAEDSIHPEYQQRLNAMDEQLILLDQNQHQITDLLCTPADTDRSIPPYASVLNNTSKALHANRAQAAQTARMFGMQMPTAQQLQVMDQYLEASTILMHKVDRVMDELMQIQGAPAPQDQSLLESCLNDLAATTAYFQQSMQTTR